MLFSGRFWRRWMLLLLYEQIPCLSGVIAEAKLGKQRENICRSDMLIPGYPEVPSAHNSDRWSVQNTRNQTKYYSQMVHPGLQSTSETHLPEASSWAGLNGDKSMLQPLWPPWQENWGRHKGWAAWRSRCRRSLWYVSSDTRADKGNCTDSSCACPRFFQKMLKM